MRHILSQIVVLEDISTLRHKTQNNTGHPYKIPNSRKHFGHLSLSKKCRQTTIGEQIILGPICKCK